MTLRQTTPVRIYEEDKKYLLLTRGTGTPADALKKVITKYNVILETVKEDLK